MVLKKLWIYRINQQTFMEHLLLFPGTTYSLCEHQKSSGTEAQYGPKEKEETGAPNDLFRGLLLT